MDILICAVVGYLIGAVNPAFLLGKKRGVDIRTKGSGNAGASNVLIVFGKALGVLCALLDIAKAYFALALTSRLCPEAPCGFAVTAVFTVIGHIFPFYMHFKGGKGLACLGGIVLYYNWRVFAIMLTVELLVALVTDYICFVPLTASAAFPLVVGMQTGDWATAGILAVIALIMVSKHMENLSRIRQGTEVHLSYLWKPQAERERMKDNLGVDDETLDRHLGGS